MCWRNILLATSTVHAESTLSMLCCAALRCRCALFMKDHATVAAICQEMGGARAGQILPVILTHQGRNKAETEAARKAAGEGGCCRLLAAAS
jgi:hypothetical protein